MLSSRLGLALSLLIGAGCQQSLRPPSPQRAASTGAAPAARATKSAPKPKESKRGLAAGARIASPSAATRALGALLVALRAQKGKDFHVAKTVAAQIPTVAKLSGDDALPSKGRVELVEVRYEKLPLAAFVRVKAAGVDEPALYAASVQKDKAGKERLVWSIDDFAVSESKVFDAKGRKVAVRWPLAKVGLPVFELRFDYRPAQSSLESVEGQRVEVYHLRGAKRLHDDAIILDGDTSRPGLDSSTRSWLRWIPRGPSKALLAVTRVVTEVTHPCTGGGGGGTECKSKTSCRRKTVLFEVGVDSAEASVDPVAVWSKKLPAKALAPDGSAETTKGCRKLAQTP